MDPIKQIELFPLQIPRDTPYLGPLEEGVTVSERGYFVRPGNQTIYSVHDHSLLIKLTTASGAVGWGESFGVLTPRTAATIIEDLITPLVLGRDPHDVVAISEDIYNGMRVRGFFGGFYVDALAGIDMALWDLRGKLTGLPVCKLLGAQRHQRIPAYVSGLPKATVDERAQLAKEWLDKGFGAVKFAAAVAHEGELVEMQAIRQAVGAGPKILVDFHWKYTDQEAIKLITQLEAYDLYVAEAPVQSEDMDGQAIAVERFAGNNGLGFSGQLDGQPFRMAVTPGTCGDDMSDRTYPFVVTLQVRGEDRQGCAWTDAQPFEGDAAP